MFNKKVAVVTGAASGIGEALAVRLAQRGCDLALSDVNDEGLQRVAAQVEKCGVRVTATVLDVGDHAAMVAWANGTMETFGRINLLFNNAGVSLAANVSDSSIEEFEWVMRVNYWGVVNGTLAFLPHLKTTNDGHIANISSVFGLIGVPTQAAYASSKFAVRGFTESLRMELELDDCKVSVTSVHPGGVATNLTKSGRVNERLLDATGLNKDEYADKLTKLIQTTSAGSAAEAILRAIENNARSVIVGGDAKLISLVQRLVGDRYQKLLATSFRLQRKLNKGGLV